MPPTPSERPLDFECFPPTWVVRNANSTFVYVGDAVRILPLLPVGSIDSLVTDPPYGLEFADNDWDGAKGFRESLDIDSSAMSDGEVFEAWSGHGPPGRCAH